HHVTVEIGQRLCLLVDAGTTRFAIPATSVLEVATADASGAAQKSHLQLKDLSELLGGPKEVRPGTAIILDTSPTLAVRVRRVREVMDVGAAPLLKLPRRRADRLEPAVRGVVQCGAELFFELDVDAVARGVPLGI